MLKMSNYLKPDYFMQNCSFSQSDYLDMYCPIFSKPSKNSRTQETIIFDVDVSSDLDIENCQVPRSCSASTVINFIRKLFILNRPDHREFDFLVACDATKIKKTVSDEINKAGGVTLAHVSDDSKNAADEKLREAMKKFVDIHGQSNPTLVLISGDIDFVKDLRGYQTRLGCYVILIHKKCYSQHLQTGWNEIYPFDTIVAMMKRDQNDNSCKSQQTKKVLRKQIEKKPKPASSAKRKSTSEVTKSKNVTSKSVAQMTEKKRAPKKISQNKEMKTVDKENVRTTKDVRKEWILVVNGLPKIDDRILEDIIRAKASKVNGSVELVQNCQGFISFTRKKHFENAISLFDGMEVHGKKLSTDNCHKIPFDNPTSIDKNQVSRGNEKAPAVYNLFKI